MPVMPPCADDEALRGLRQGARQRRRVLLAVRAEKEGAGMKRERSDARLAADRKGGYSTLLRFGRERMTEWGKRGGRPRLLTLAEINDRPGIQEKEKGSLLR